MSHRLTRADERYLAELLTWDDHRRPGETVAVHTALALGAACIVVAIIVTLADLTDSVIRAVLIPGVVAGILLVLVFLLGRARIRDRHHMADVARHLSETD